MAIKERPILFSSPMVRALLSGTKTQTRRFIKHQNDGPYYGVTDGEPWYMDEAGIPHTMPCPYGNPGDRLLVREGLMAKECAYGRKIAYQADGAFCKMDRIEIDLPDGGKHVEAAFWKWKNAKLPSIHMPMKACRIGLEITDVRIQRLQEISEDDAIAEGMDGRYVRRDEAGKMIRVSKGGGGLTPVKQYQYLWDSINGEGSWEKNPWVWALTFKRL